MEDYFGLHKQYLKTIDEYQASHLKMVVNSFLNLCDERFIDKFFNYDTCVMMCIIDAKNLGRIMTQDEEMCIMTCYAHKDEALNYIEEVTPTIEKELKRVKLIGNVN